MGTRSRVRRQLALGSLHLTTLKNIMTVETTKMAFLVIPFLTPMIGTRGITGERRIRFGTQPGHHFSVDTLSHVNPEDVFTNRNIHSPL